MSNKEKTLSVEAQVFSDILKERAMQFGMCKKGQEEWRERKTFDSLLDMYVKNMEFILDHPDFVTDDFLLENAGDKKLHEHGIYVDELFSITVPQDLVVRGNCDGEVLCACFSTPDIYVCGKSKVNVRVLSHSISYIRVYDKAVLDIECDKGGKVFVYQYGGTVIYSGEGKVFVRDKRGKHE